MVSAFDKLKIMALLGWVIAICSILFIGFLRFAQTSSNTYEKKFEILVEELAIRLNNDDNNERVIGVVPFTTIDGKETSIGKFFAQEVTLALANKRKSFKIVDRLSLAQVIEEHDFASTGLIDPSSALQRGKLLAANVLITGIIETTKKEAILSLKAIEVEDGNILVAVSKVIPLTQLLSNLRQDTKGNLILMPKEDKPFFIVKSIDFFIQNWPWIWTVLIIPIFGWLVRKISKLSGKEQKK